MKELLQNENIRKCIKLFAVSLGVILVIKYLLPVFWPFVLAYFLGELVCRLSDFLNRKLQFHYKVAAIFSLVVIVILIFVCTYASVYTIICPATIVTRQI